MCELNTVFAESVPWYSQSQGWRNNISEDGAKIFTAFPLPLVSLDAIGPLSLSFD